MCRPSYSLLHTEVHCKCEVVIIPIFSASCNPFLDLTSSLEGLHLRDVLQLRDVMCPKFCSYDYIWNTAGNDTQLKTRIVTISHLQCTMENLHQKSKTNRSFASL